MKKTMIAALAVAILALAASQLAALQVGTWECMGYTITVTPDDPEDPQKSGTIEIYKEDDYAIVEASGVYYREGVKQPATVVDLTAVITTPDGVEEVSRTFTFSPGPKKTVWKTILSWLESEIAN
ncbi:MAG: hypothetical protein ACPL7K_03110 [Armatimonadota bacterium]